MGISYPITSHGHGRGHTQNTKLWLAHEIGVVALKNALKIFQNNKIWPVGYVARVPVNSNNNKLPVLRSALS